MDDINQYKILHKTNNDYGRSGINLLEEVCLIIDYLEPKTILDYGCGKGNLVGALKEKYPNISVYGYDPAVENFDKLPVSKADLVINTDVLEHIPEDQLENVVKEISGISQNVFFNLSHVKATAILPNGENAHCTVKPLLWYYELFKKYFKTQTILPGRRKFLSVVLTFSVHPQIVDDYYDIIDKDANIEKENKLESKHKFVEKIFSVKNAKNGKKEHKVITILGIKLKFRK